MNLRISDLTLVGHSTLKAVDDTIVLAVKTASLDHLILWERNRSENCKQCLDSWGRIVHRFLDREDKTNLVLDEKLDTLDGGGSRLRDSSGHTAHWKHPKNISNLSVTSQKYPPRDYRGVVSPPVMMDKTYS